MKVYSGKCLEGICGTPTGFKDVYGTELFVGDIVVVFTTDESGYCSYGDGLTVVVDGRYTTYADGSIKEDSEPDFFVMGIKTAWPKEDEGDPEEKEWRENRWNVRRVKKWEDVIDGEHWADFGFNYKNN